MGIRFVCEHCGATLNVKKHQAGQSGICPKCSQALTVPSVSTLVSDAEKTIVNSEATQSFHPSELSPPKKQKRAAAKASPAKTIRDAQPTRQEAPTVGGETKKAQTGPVVPEPDGNSFMLDKPSNPWLQPNAPDAVESGMGKVWYIRDHKDGERGPIKGKNIPDLLKKNEIRPNSYVWREDWEDWVRADLVFKQLKRPDGDNDDRVFTDPNCPIPKGYEKKALAAAGEKNNRVMFLVVAIILGLATIGGLGWLLYSLV